jgi:hypothetical protein
MRNLFKLLALGALYLPAVAFAGGPEHRFTHKGVSYTYTVTLADNGRRVIEGRNLWTGARFRFVVDGDRVEGTSGGQPVSFRTPKRGAVTLAAR